VKESKKKDKRNKQYAEIYIKEGSDVADLWYNNRPKYNRLKKNKKGRYLTDTQVEDQTNPSKYKEK